jgi:hypothetical protein
MRYCRVGLHYIATNGRTECKHAQESLIAVLFFVHCLSDIDISCYSKCNPQVEGTYHVMPKVKALLVQQK